MTNIIQDVAGVDFMTEKDIVTEMLLTGKNGIQRTCAALTEATTMALRESFQKQLNQMIDQYGMTLDYAVKKGYHHPYNPSTQFKDDLKEAYVALDLEAWKLLGDEESFGPKGTYPTLRS